MNAVFVDSSVWIDHFRRSATPEVGLLRRLLLDLRPDAAVDVPTSILVGDVVLLEVLRGIPDDAQHRRTRSILLAFPQVEVGGTANALSATDHYRALRRQGVTVRKSIDCLIAAWCIAHHVPLLHNDRDFRPFARHRGLLEFIPAAGDGC